ncbi:MAG: 1-deoxy-D-xylulose-5-phosphate reductoisomerase [Nesterenkonia sp.]|nr:1-deoxy-D-xylulose-5-phosphate reductoisomerase [Nesterenkonia sp.]
MSTPASAPGSSAAASGPCGAQRRDAEARAVPRRRRVAILGSTGSIGTQALAVIDAHPDRFEVVALAAGSDTELLARQAARTGARCVAIAVDGGTPQNPRRPALHEALRGARRTEGLPEEGPEVLTGADAAEQIAGEVAEAHDVDVVLNGMTGSVGLRPTLAALSAGVTLALANKESLVVGGALVAAAQRRPGQVVPVDSEHSALAQALASGRHERGMCAPTVTGRTEVSRLVVTASGGPFRGRSPDQLAAVTPEQALKHPNYSMGRVVTTNSATLVNKALEVVEAHLLFDVPLDDVEAVVHPQQIIHSMVEFHDGSTLAQAGPPRMMVPIALGLTWPDRLPAVDEPLDWTRPMSWDFEPLDHAAFPAVRLAKQACAASATHMAVYNAANEQAVDAFHERRLRFDGILGVVQEVLARHDDTCDASVATLELDTVLEAEHWARQEADALIAAARTTPSARAGGR